MSHTCQLNLSVAAIFTHFSAGETQANAVSKLLISHQRYPQQFPRVDFREVDFWYNSFANGNFNLCQQPTYPEKSKLENLAVLDKIINDVNTKDQKSLRAVCKNTKNLIDSQNRLYQEIRLHLNQNSVFLAYKTVTAESPTKIVFARRDEGCEITLDGVKTMSEKLFIVEAMEKFKDVVEKINTKVEKLIVKHNPNVVDNDSREQFFGGIVRTLQSLKDPLHVEGLMSTCHELEEFNAILEFIKPISLTRLDFKVHNDAIRMIEVNRINHLTSHWPHLEFLCGPTIVATDITIDSLCHISEILFMILETVTPEEIVEYRNKILQSTTFKQHTFFLDNAIDRESIINAMKPCAAILDDGFDEETDSTYYRIPFSDVTTGHLVFRYTTRELTFQRRKYFRKLE